MNIKTKAPSSLDSAFARARRNAHEQHMKVAGHSWIDISKALPNNRTERAVSSHWNEMQKEIAEAFPDRTRGAITSRWKILKTRKMAGMSLETTDDSIGVTLASLNPNPHVRLVHARKKIITQRRVQTRWRHAMRHPDLTAYRKTVDAMNESNIKLRLQDRLKNMDEIDKKGSIEQKKRCLEYFLSHGQRGILPRFYSVVHKDGVRYPGDGGPDPQVETDHESVEGEADDLLTEAQISRPKRGRHVERRRQNVKDSRARRLMRQALTEDPKMSKTNSRTFIDLKKLGVALGRQWPIYPGFQIVIDQLQKVRDGSDAEVSLLTLDTEFISTSRRILEVAVGELHSGRVLVGAKADHQCTTEELLKKPDDRPMIYGPGGQEKCSGKETAREIAETLQKAGVTQTSIILVWHVNTFDLTILKELLESAGYRHILPPKENCIPIIKHYRAGLPARDRFERPFSVKLDHLFPILFAEHQLVGTNHNAVPDIQMLRLMVLLLVQLQKPPSERDLTEFPTTAQEFVGSANPPYTFLERWLGLSQPNLGDEGNEEDDSDGEEEEDDDDDYEDEDESNGDGDWDKA
ncbi:zinc finger 76 (expressed in testis) [Fusarium albosuccineum]|uniref:Zinc finger 76 (Expressed in testis) n=1 Tax=Fusarium albosuccineum TaxID=1237068 RepID=A0A8H4PCZ1_9HYPO|nr:zinc finger 76 (expressed in testis) [Fusarium albosuccineum]